MLKTRKFQNTYLPPHENIDTTTEFLYRCIQCWIDETAFPWIITSKNDNTLLGIEIRIDRFRADFGYRIARQYWGNGYSTEAAKVIIQWALDQESIYRVWAICIVENLASARVMEKAGMQEEGILRRFLINSAFSFVEQNWRHNTIFGEQ